MITIDIYCDDCHSRYVTLEEAGEATWTKRWDCPQCEGKDTIKRVMSAPMVLKASWPDGHRSRSNLDLKEAARLEVLKASLPPEERHGISKEINKLKSLKE